MRKWWTRRSEAGQAWALQKEDQMTVFQVQDCKNGPGKNPWVKVDAQSAQEAAVRVCGIKLRDLGRPGELRARVVRDGDLAPRKETAFYADPNSN
jgi:hypothetical protein